MQPLQALDAKVLPLCCVCTPVPLAPACLGAPLAASSPIASSLVFACRTPPSPPPRNLPTTAGPRSSTHQPPAASPCLCPACTLTACFHFPQEQVWTESQRRRGKPCGPGSGAGGCEVLPKRKGKGRARSGSTPHMLHGPKAHFGFASGWCGCGGRPGNADMQWQSGDVQCCLQPTVTMHARAHAHPFRACRASAARGAWASSAPSPSRSST